MFAKSIYMGIGIKQGDHTIYSILLNVRLTRHIKQNTQHCGAKENNTTLLRYYPACQFEL